MALRLYRAAFAHGPSRTYAARSAPHVMAACEQLHPVERQMLGEVVDVTLLATDTRIAVGHAEPGLNPALVPAGGAVDGPAIVATASQWAAWVATTEPDIATADLASERPALLLTSDLEAT